MKKAANKVKAADKLRIAITIILILLAITYFIGAAQAFVLYADKPITEIPMWAYWFLAPRK